MKFKLLCFGSHLLISLIIALFVVCLVFWLWYPSPLDKALGVVNVFLLLLCIDVVVGPLLTLIVAKQGKRTLKMDLSAIAVIQLAALIYGLYIVAQGRPVWIIYDSARFEVVQAYEAVIDPASASSDVFRLGFLGPIWGGVSDVVPDSVGQGDAYYQAEYLKTYDETIAAKVGANAISLEVLKRFNDPTVLEPILSLYPDADAYVPLVAKQKALSVLINKNSGHSIAIVELSPW